MSLKAMIPGLPFLIHFIVASVVDKKVRLTDRIAALIPISL